jgi:hypothetical protein
VFLRPLHISLSQVQACFRVNRISKTNLNSLQVLKFELFLLSICPRFSIYQGVICPRFSIYRKELKYELSRF